MTKAAEIKLLDEFIKKLGPDSYIGPVIKNHRDVIAANILNDFPAFMGTGLRGLK